MFGGAGHRGRSRPGSSPAFRRATVWGRSFRRGLQHRRAEGPGLCGRQPRGRRVHAAIGSSHYRRSRRGHYAAATVLLARLGHRPDDAGPRVVGAPADDPAIMRVAAWLRSRQTTAPRRSGAHGRCPAGRLVFRIRQRVLSRRRRYRHVVDGPADAFPLWRFTPGRRRAEALHAGLALTRTLRCPLGDSDKGSLGLKEAVGTIERGMRWMLAMQNRDGGWGAFDMNNDRHFLCYVPFADHNAMIDPSTADLCGRVLEALGKLGRRLGDPHVDRAVEFVRRTQEADGSWFGRWGVNYIYGTWQVLTGLVGVGISPDDPVVVAAPSGCWPTSRPMADGASRPIPMSDRNFAVRGRPPHRRRLGHSWACLRPA